MLRIGYKKPLEEEDLFDLIQKEEDSKYLTTQIEKEWNKELLKLKMNKKPSLASALFRLYWLRVILVSFLALLEVSEMK